MIGTRSKSAKAGASASKPEKKIVKKTDGKSSKASKASGPSKISLKSAAEIERDESGVGYWYFRSEPTTRMQNGHDVKFSIEDLKNEENAVTTWDGVRNYSARNFMREMKVGDRGLFYHSNAGKETGVVGTVTIVKEAYPDHTAWDRNSAYFSDKGSKDSPVWDMVDVKHVSTFKKIITRESLKEGLLKDMYMIRQGRISVGPVRVDEWKKVMKMSEEE